MSRNSLLQNKIAALAGPLLAPMGLEVWGLEFLAGKRALLRLYIETAGGRLSRDGAAGPGIDECEKVSRLLGLVLDAEDIVPFPYILEVSTPGLERPLFTAEQLAACLEQEVEIALAAPPEAFAGRKRFRGWLCAALSPQGADPWRFALRPREEEEDGSFCATAAGEKTEHELNFDWTQVKKARLLYVWPEKPGVPKRASKRRTK
ncbi:MAG: ribosome maturation factor RimP [Deltaproteobacteria bacterium]|jgi:ribosome maturation factor RimP|nr:ribosome maturation factor RimP [Deltaproteobacteria bacterium]